MEITCETCLYGGAVYHKGHTYGDGCRKQGQRPYKRWGKVGSRAGDRAQTEPSIGQTGEATRRATSPGHAATSAAASSSRQTSNLTRAKGDQTSRDELTVREMKETVLVWIRTCRPQREDKVRQKLNTATDEEVRAKYVKVMRKQRKQEETPKRESKTRRKKNAMRRQGRSKTPSRRQRPSRRKTSSPIRKESGRSSGSSGSRHTRPRKRATTSQIQVGGTAPHQPSSNSPIRQESGRTAKAKHSTSRAAARPIRQEPGRCKRLDASPQRRSTAAQHKQSGGNTT